MKQLPRQKMDKLLLTVTIICTNEEKKIRGALESVFAWVDEIVVIDGGSVDSTVEICNEYTDKVFINPWQGWIKQKNLAIEKSKNKWILSLDADERVTDDLKKEIEIELSKGGYDGYYIPIKPFYLGKPINHCGWYPGYKLRFFNKEKGKWGGAEPHESLLLQGNTKKLKKDIHHFAYDSVLEHLKKIEYYSKVGAEKLIKEGKKANFFDLTLRPFFTFFKSYILQFGFLDGWVGFLVCVFSSYANFAKYSQVWEGQRVKGKG